jgi:hypothetical protein
LRSSLDTQFPLPVDPEKTHPELDLPPFGDYPSRGTDLSNYAFWAWYRSATRVYNGVGEPRVRLNTGMHATALGLYALSGSTDSDVNSTLPPSLPRLANISTDIIETFRRQVALLTHTETSSGTDWRTLTDVIVTRYGEAIAELHLFLSEGSDWSLRKARLALVALILPHHVGGASIQSNLDTCAHSLIGATDSFVSSLNDYEQKILHALLHVQRTICGTLLELHQAFDVSYAQARSRTQPLSQSVLSPSVKTSVAISFDSQLWAGRMQSLMDVLNWNMWLRCEQVCKWNEICHIPIWPLVSAEKRDVVGRPKPKCVDWESSGDA